MTMSDPGLYLTNATGETVPVHTEGHRDLQLLAEYLVENDLEDVVDETRVKTTGETPMTDGGVTEQDYDWQLRVTLNGVDFTGPGCATKQEAQALETVVRDADGVESTEVERR